MRTPSATDPERDVLVIGGGLAGIAAALDCAQAGARVTLVEVRRRLGGAAYSFERDGLHIDNGQHVFLRCCTAYRGLLARFGSERGVVMQERLRIPVLSPGRESVVLSRGRLPAPLHLAGALMRYRHLSLTQRLGAARAALAIGRLDPADETLERQTFGEWLAGRGQSTEAVAALWDLIALPTLNLPAAQASPGLSAFVFQTALLASASAGDIGFHERPLSETIAEPALRALARAGVEVRLGWRAERIERVGVGLQVRGAGAGDAPDTLDAQAVIVAVPHARAAGLLDDLAPDAAGRLRALGSSPIVNLHVVYDRPVSEHRFAAGVGTPVQYLFDRTAAGGVPPGCQYLAVSLSGAEREMQMSVDELRERYLPALAALLPRARRARVEMFLATREHAATFRAVPGVARLRPGAQTSVPGLVLAGAWTDTGWPATLEGAVLSGHTAARVAVRALDIAPAAGAPAPAPDRQRGAWMSDGPLIAAPLRIEAALISSTARGARVRKTGMGPERARAAAGQLAREPGAGLLVLGFCGGLDAESAPGEVIVAETVCSASDEGHAPERVACADLEGLTGRLRARGMKVRSGEIVCVSKLALGERRAQLLAGGALAVDMESVWLAAGAAGRPFAVVRVVLDSPSHELLRPQAAGGALRAARALRRVAGALGDWTPPWVAVAVGPSRSAGGDGRSRSGGPGSAGLQAGPSGD